MFLDKINRRLFKPLSSAHNSMAYETALWALYKRLIVNHSESPDPSPKECRDAIRYALIEKNQRIDWEKEIIDESDIFIEPDDAGRIYRYLKSCGWMCEMDEIGYRRITYMPRMAASLITALENIAIAKPEKVGATCLAVYLTLRGIKEDPDGSAAALELAVTIARDYGKKLNNIIGSSREIAHEIMEESKTAKKLAHFFNGFVKGVLLTDYTELKSKNHPYKYRTQTIQLVEEMYTNTELIKAMTQGIKKTESDKRELSEIEDQIRRDLLTISKSFQHIDELLKSIDSYRQMMTRRTRDAMEYALSATPNLSMKLEKVIKRISGDRKNEIFPARVSTDEAIGPTRIYVPKNKTTEAKKIKIEERKIPFDEIASSRAMAAYLNRRAENTERLERLIERTLGSRNFATTDEVIILSVDDFIAYIQLRGLINESIPKGSMHWQLIKKYKVKTVVGELTKNKYLIAPKLRIERRVLR